MCGASNLSVDNILERLLALPPGDKGEKLRMTRIGHPARVMSHEGVLDATLDAKAGRSDQVEFILIVDGCKLTYFGSWKGCVGEGCEDRTGSDTICFIWQRQRQG